MKPYGPYRSQTPLWDPLGATLWKTPRVHASRTRPERPKVAQSRPKDSLTPLPVCQKSSRNPVRNLTKFRHVCQMEFWSPMVLKYSISAPFLDALGDEIRWSNENIDFRKIARTLEREHQFSHFFHEIFNKFCLNIASETNSILISRFSLILPPKWHQNDPKLAQKST